MTRSKISRNKIYLNVYCDAVTIYFNYTRIKVEIKLSSQQYCIDYTSYKIFFKRIINLHANRFSNITDWNDGASGSLLCVPRAVCSSGWWYSSPTLMLRHSHQPVGPCTHSLYSTSPNGQNQQSPGTGPGHVSPLFHQPSHWLFTAAVAFKHLSKERRIRQQVELHQEPFKSQFGAIASFLSLVILPDLFFYLYTF